MRTCTFLVLSILTSTTSITTLRAAAGEDSCGLPRAEDVTMLWWEHGAPYYFTMQETAPKQVLCVQSGSCGVMMDTQSLQILHAGRFPQILSPEEARSGNCDQLTQLPPEILQMQVTCDGVVYRCAGRAPDPDDPFYFPVRFIEYGRCLQRVAVERIRFVADDAQRNELLGRLEIAFWPDRCTLALGVDSGSAEARGELMIAVGTRQAVVPLTPAGTVTLELIAPVDERGSIQHAADIASRWDEALSAHIVDLPMAPWANSQGTYYPSDELDRLDRWPLVVRNDTDHDAVVPMMFVPQAMPAITGLTPMLCDADGTPTGIPVQTSKNWHARPDKGDLPHQGPWVHACAWLRLPPRSSRELVFSLAYARYGGVFAASHAQLSLIGWGHNQFWDQAAIGSFGESICFEPGRVQRRCFITDVRPLMTRSRDGGRWAWAENGGGGDLLLWMDSEGAYRAARRTRAEYRAQGPCLTDVEYCEETLDGAISTRAEVSLPRSDDYVRTFIHLRYDVHKPVTWQRLAFFQLGADYYNETPARSVAMGNSDQVLEQWQPIQGDDQYDRRSMALPGKTPWVSIHDVDRSRVNPGGAAVTRGLIIRQWKAVLGGQSVAEPHVATFANQWGKGNFKTAIELAPPADVQQLIHGDYVDALLELVVFPLEADAYYGPDEQFRSMLSQHADTYFLVRREATGNDLDVSVQTGELTCSYPVCVATEQGRAELTVGGGVGYVPITLTNLPSYRGYQLKLDGAIVDQSVHGNDFWQTGYDPQTGTWQMTFNVRLDGGPHTLSFSP